MLLIVQVVALESIATRCSIAPIGHVPRLSWPSSVVLSMTSATEGTGPHTRPISGVSIVGERLKVLTRQHLLNFLHLIII